MEISVACHEKKKSGERDALLLLNFRERVGNVAAAAESGGLAAAVLNFCERAVDAAAVMRGGRAGWTDSHRYSHNGPGRLVGAWPGSGTERERETVETARQDRLFFCGRESWHT